MKIILASTSPRRREIMDLAGIEYEVIPSNYEEKLNPELGLEDQSIELAYGKAKAVFDNTQGDRCVIGADSLVILDGKQLGKPKDRRDAKQMLESLQGRKHEVFTSFAILYERGGEVKEIKDLDITNVYLRNMSSVEIEDYIEREKPYDKAGGYGIQTSFCVYLDKIEGDFYTVMGLPIGKIYGILKDNELL